ncbi:MAG: hypothetical protein OXG11_12555 [Chloroflexi bacterium]|nr:hypothetical protein [Chloroflexota bacterium]
MGFLGGGPGGGRDDGLYLYVQSNKTGEKIRVRINLGNDLTEQFEDVGDNVSHYICHKDVMGNESFEIIRLEVEFDRNRNMVGHTISGGRLISEEEYLADAGSESADDPSD